MDKDNKEFMSNFIKQMNDMSMKRLFENLKRYQSSFNTFQAQGEERYVRVESENTERVEDMTATATPKIQEPVFKNVGLDYHNDGKIVLPSGMSPKSARAWLTTIEEEQESWTAFSEDTNTFLLDGAKALAVAINRFAGFMSTVPTPGFFGSTPPTMVTLEIDHTGETISIPWGRIVVPGITGHLDTGYTIKDGRVFFRVAGKCQKKDLPKIQAIFENMREEIRKNSIYRGKAFSVNLQFNPENPTENPPRFINHTKREEGTLIFNKGTEGRINTSLLGPIKNAAVCRELGIPLKRGVLLYGIYGVGKSELAALVANVAVGNGWTYIYLEDARNLVAAYAMAKHFSPCVIFCEDIDKVTSGERTEEMNKLLNCMDGLTSKGEEIMTVFTTNCVETMHPGFMRPGRLDDVIEIAAPDKDAAIKLVQLFAGATLDSTSNLDRIGDTLVGQVPALIREVVERCRLASVARTRSPKFKINDDDVVNASNAMRTHRDFIMGKTKPLEKSFVENIGRHALGAVLQSADTVIIDGKPYSLKESVANGSVDAEALNSK